jgi:glyoxylase-like metal-dependent hydrolase (beta-lactamase superfamily II)
MKIANFFLLVNDRELTLIDTGSKDEIENIRGKFDEAGHSLDHLKRIIPTHCHPDHIGSLAALKLATGAEVLAHEAEAPFINHEARLLRARGPAWLLHTLTEPLFRPEPCPVDQTLKHGDSIEGTGLTVIHTPGHSPGSICLYHREARALFTGDALMNVFGKMRGPFPPFCWETQRARRSLAGLVELDVETIYFSHGKTIREGANERIRSLVEALNGV